MNGIALAIFSCEKQLYTRLCPSVGPSVGPSVHDAFVKIADNGVMQDGDASYVVYTALFHRKKQIFWIKIRFFGLKT